MRMLLPAGEENSRTACCASWPHGICIGADTVSCHEQDKDIQIESLEQQLEGSIEKVVALSEGMAKLEQQHNDNQARSQQWQVKADIVQQDLLSQLERKQQEHADLMADLDKVLKAKERLSDEVNCA